MYGTIWQLYNDVNHQSKDEHIKFNMTTPHLSLNIQKISDEGQILVTKFNEYLKIAFQLSKEVDSLFGVTRSQHYEISKKMVNSDTLLEGARVDPTTNSNAVRTSRTNFQKITKGKEVIEYLNAIVSETAKNYSEFTLLPQSDINAICALSEMEIELKRKIIAQLK